MGRKELHSREIWQDISGVKALKAEQNLYEVFKTAFAGTEYMLHEKPTHLKNLYAQVQLTPEVLEQIFNPDIDLKNTKWGVSPDFAIENKVLVVVMLMKGCVSYLPQVY